VGIGTKIWSGGGGELSAGHILAIPHTLARGVTVATAQAPTA